MQNYMNIQKGIFVGALAVLFVLIVAPLHTQAYYSDVSSIDYSYPASSGDSGTNSHNSSSGDYSGGCCTSSYYSDVSSINYSYPATTNTNTTPTYYSDVSSINYSYPATPTYYTPTYYTYSYPSCTGNCGGSYTPPTYVTPTCSISASNTSVYAGDTVNIGWSSTNANSGYISNLGGVSTSGSRQITLNNTTTFNGSFYGNGGTATCSTTVYVNPKPAPTCTITGPDTAVVGQTITLNWTSTNATRGDIQNLGTNLAPNDSHSFVINNTTTFYGTFYSADGQSTNCQKTVTINQNNNLSCTISINNYSNGYNNYFAPNTAVTLSWNSNGASYGYINQGLGNVGLSGSRTIYPAQTTTYTGTFYNYNGQQVTCSATVYVNGYVPPVNPGTPIVTLSQVPYTGLDLGPVGTVLYWGFIAFWCALAAYLIVIKKVQNSVYSSLKGILFGAGASHSAPTSTTHASHVSHAAPAEADATDPFIVSQINRIRG